MAKEQFEKGDLVVFDQEYPFVREKLNTYGGYEGLPRNSAEYVIVHSIRSGHLFVVERIIDHRKSIVIQEFDGVSRSWSAEYFTHPPMIALACRKIMELRKGSKCDEK